MTQKSHEPSHPTNLMDTIQSGHFHSEHILLDLDKYVLLVLLLFFLPVTPFHLWGSVGVVNGLLTFVYLLI